MKSRMHFLLQKLLADFRSTYTSDRRRVPRVNLMHAYTCGYFQLCHFFKSITRVRLVGIVSVCLCFMACRHLFVPH